MTFLSLMWFLIMLPLRIVFFALGHFRLIIFPLRWLVLYLIRQTFIFRIYLTTQLGLKTWRVVNFIRHPRLLPA